MAYTNDPLGSLINPLQPDPQMPQARPPYAPLGAMVQPQQVQPPMAPQQPDDMQQRVSGWDSFLQQLSNPDVAKSLIAAGAQMTTPRQLGETQGSKIAQGLAQGVGTYQNLQDNRFAQGQDQQRTNILQQQADTSLLGTQSDVSSAQNRNDLIDAQRKEIEAELDPEVKAAKLAKLKAEAERDRASAAADRSGRSSAGSPSSQMQQFLLGSELYKKSGRPEDEANALAYQDAFGDPEKQFKRKAPDEYKLEIIAGILKDPLGQIPKGPDGNPDYNQLDAIAEAIVKPYRQAYDAQTKEMKSTGVGSRLTNPGGTVDPNDPNSRYQHYLQLRPNPNAAQKAAIISQVRKDIGDPNWNPPQ